MTINSEMWLDERREPPRKPDLPELELDLTGFHAITDAIRANLPRTAKIESDK